MTVTPFKLVPPANYPVPPATVNAGPGINTLGYDIDGNPPRFQTIDDLHGLGRKVVKCVLLPGDEATYWGTQRCELWEWPRPLREGDVVWRAWSVYFGDGTRGDPWGASTAPAGATVGQVHAGDGYSPTSEFCPLPDGGINFDMRGAPRESWLLPIKVSDIEGKIVQMAFVTKMSTKADGYVKFWLALDKPPDVKAAPMKEWTNIVTMNVPPGGITDPGLHTSWDKIGIYAGQTTQNKLTCYWYGCGRTTAPETAMADAGMVTISDPPPPDEPPTVALTVYKVRDTASTITLGWNILPLPVIGFRFTREQAHGKWSHSYNSAMTEATFSKDSAWYKVEALLVGDQWP